MTRSYGRADNTESAAHWISTKMTKKHDTGARMRLAYDREGGVLAAFSGKVADYAAARPDYPAPLFETLIATCGLTDKAVIADLGSGTGLLTQGFLQRGFRVFAVEPNDAMRSAGDHLLGKFPEYRSIDGSAESIPLESASVDLVTAAQAFHWFDIDRARTECLRILRPTGNVALIWNDRVFEDSLHRALDEIFAEFGGAKRAALVSHEKGRSISEFFGSTIPKEFSWPHEHRLGEEGLVSLVLSRSYMPARESAAGKEIALRVSELFRKFANADLVSVRYRTVARVGRPAPSGKTGSQ